MKNDEILRIYFPLFGRDVKYIYEYKDPKNNALKFIFDTN